MSPYEEKTMNKGQTIDALSDMTGIQKKDCAAILDAQDTLIGQCLAKEKGEYTLGKSGKLVSQERAARTARNPTSGASIEVPAKRVAKLKASKDLLAAIA